MPLFSKRRAEEAVTVAEASVWNPPQHPVYYPKWTSVCILDTHEYYLIMDKTKKKFISERAYLSWGYQALWTTREAISNYPLNGQLGFRSGCIIQATGQTQQYYIEDNEARLIGTPDVYSILGFDSADALIVSLDELDFHKKGKDIRVII